MAVLGNVKIDTNTKQFKKGIKKVQRQLFWFKIRVRLISILDYFKF